METIVGDYLGTTTGIHSPIPYYAPGSTEGVLESKLSFNYLDFEVTREKKV